MATHKNRLVTTISNTPSTTGALTISTAQSGYRTFVAGDDGKSFDVVIVDGTAWEVRTACTYTHSGTSLARGTLEDSSTGSAIDLTSSAVVTVTATADAGRRWDAAALSHVAGTDASTTMVVNTLYVVDMSAWATADRTYTLPATAAVGDRVGVLVTAGDASHELIITAAAGDTLNGVAGGTEWSRLFMTGEIVVMRCVAANATWIVEEDGRKFESCRIDTDGTTASHAATSSTKVSSELATVTSNPQSIWDSTNKRLTPRRLGRYLIHGHVQLALVATGAAVAQIYKNGSTSIGGGTTSAGSAYPEADTFLFYDVTTLGDYFELFVYNGDSSSRNTNNANVYFEATRIGDAS